MVHDSTKQVAAGLAPIQIFLYACAIQNFSSTAKNKKDNVL
jgi:hypothetical protein